MRILFPLLYWFGLILALIGVCLRFWMGSLTWGLGLAVLGVALLLCARLAQSLRNQLRRNARHSGSRGRR